MEYACLFNIKGSYQCWVINDSMVCYIIKSCSLCVRECVCVEGVIPK